ncbi:MAG TPA: methanogenesis marker 8 protein [Candidatus Methanoperedens sp.]
MPKSRHVMELQGRTRVVVENGKVIEVGVPMTEYCPIFDKVRGIKKFTPKTAKENVEFRMRDFGMFTENRELEMEIFVGFGASETFMTALRRGLLDTTITVCDGAGTVITGNPRLCQGMGSRISGLTETSPIKRLIERIQAAGGVVLDPDTAAIDQVRGVQKAIELGYRKIGVSVASLSDLKEIRNIEKESGKEIIAFGVHATGMPDNEAKEFIELVDMATGCTSKWIRAGVAGKTIAQFGTAVPIFAITRRGRELLLERAKEVRDPILVNTMKLPVLPDEKQPRPLV